MRSQIVDRWTHPRNSCLWITLGVTTAVMGLRAMGWMQGAEFQVTDQYFRIRPAESLDPRVVIIGINETDLQRSERWPLSDAQISQLLFRVQQGQPRVIGLNIHRDRPIAPGSRDFENILATFPNLISIEQLENGKASEAHGNINAIPPHPQANPARVGFNNIILDDDQKVRRAFLYWKTDWKTDRDGSAKESFALKLSKFYLAQNQIYGKPAPDRSSDLKLGRGIFRQIQSDTGAYVRADAGAYQILVNFRGGSKPFQVFSMQEVLDGTISSADLRDRIVIIGSTATSLRDFSATPYTNALPSSNTWMSGVALQAQIVSQILSAALDGRPVLQSWSEIGEILWIGLWTGLGAVFCWRQRRFRSAIAGVIGLTIGLVLVGYGAFLAGWLIPVMAPIVGLVGALTSVQMVTAHTEEELRRSMEFLHRIINTIPDPIFVKDKQQRWVVLNEAYAKFVGASLEDLLGKTAHEVFPKAEADLFLTRDEETFLQAREREDEEVLTDLFGEVHYIATKRSLHRDGGGNVFLVGVIRDITLRKTREEALERAKQELSASNEELRQSQTRLHYLANHDALTGLPNRALFHEKLQEAIHWADQSDRVIALLFIDLDGFKQVNDTLGHSVGDQLLKSVAKRLVSCLRASDTVARLGGDEFTVILPGSLRLAAVERVATKVIQTLAQPFNFNGHAVEISGSVGISLYPDPCHTLEELIDTADAAMYDAKTSGKNRYRVGKVKNEE
jgi:diguanylate cyclase (GGDEF)-like protein/PAS domain S-box-containing protein